MAIYLEKGQEAYSEALANWFEEKNISEWLQKYKMDFDILKIDELFAKQFVWCQNNHFQLTPTLFINGYHYPKVYDRQNLEYFINELIEDDLQKYWEGNPKANNNFVWRKPSVSNV